MKHIFVIATGGTIAGVGEAGGQRYRSGEIGVGTLLESVTGMGNEVRLSTHQLANIGSQDMSEALWFELAALIAQQLASADCDGVVIIHGTDTLEETAFFLHCVLPPSAKPVVLTGSMLPATATTADGPANLAAAILAAASDASAGRGVLVVFAGNIFTAQNVFKQHTHALAAFSGGDSGATGHVVNGAVHYYYTASARALQATALHNSLTGSHNPQASAGIDRQASAPINLSKKPDLDLKGISNLPTENETTTPAVSPPRFDLTALAAAQPLPPVAIITAHVGASAEWIAALVQLGCRGIVYAGFGNGTFSATTLAALKAAHTRGVVVVRASRVPQGGVSPCGEVDDAALGFIAAGVLNPQKTRILLSLALARGDTPQQIRRLFAVYDLSPDTDSTTPARG